MVRHYGNITTLLGLALSLMVISLLVMAAPGAVRAQDDGLKDPTGPVLLEIEGAIARANGAGVAAFDRTMLDALPAHSLETTTVVTDGVRHFEGFLMRDLLERVGAEGETVTASALNDYVIDIPMADFERFDVLVATHMDGEQLKRRGKGPLWIVYPRDDFPELQDLRYDYRWVWQLDHLVVR